MKGLRQLSGTRTAIELHRVEDERLRQERLRLAGRFVYTCASPNGMTNAEKLACLTEELGEVAQEVLTQEGRRLARDTTGTIGGLRKELTQVAAVAVAWLEALPLEGSET